MELREIPLDQLDLAEDNIRDKATDLTELAKSIATSGIIVPLSVTPTDNGRYKVVAGHRRTLAARMVAANPEKFGGRIIVAVPAVVEERSDTERVVAMLIENLQRVDISPLEEAKGYFRLVDEGLFSQSDIAERIGRSKAHVSKRLTLLTLPKLAQEQLTAGRMTIEGALQLAKLADSPDTITSLVNEYYVDADEYDLQEWARDGIPQWEITQALRRIEQHKEWEKVADKVLAKFPHLTIEPDVGHFATDPAPEGKVFTWFEEFPATGWPSTLGDDAITIAELSWVNGSLWLNFYGFVDEADEELEEVKAPTSGNPTQTAATQHQTAAREAEDKARKERDRITNAVNRHEAEHLRAWRATVAAKPSAAVVKTLTRFYVDHEVNANNASDVCQILELDVIEVDEAKPKRYNNSTHQYEKVEGTRKVKKPAETIDAFMNKAEANVTKVLVALALLRTSYCYRDQDKTMLKQLRTDTGWTDFDKKAAEATVKAKSKA